MNKIEHLILIKYSIVEIWQYFELHYPASTLSMDILVNNLLIYNIKMRNLCKFVA